MKSITFSQFFGVMLTALFLIFSTSVSLAQERELTEEQKNMMTEQIEHAKEQLQLTDEQSEAFETILTDTFQQRMAIMEKYGINPSDPNFKRPGMSTMRKMRKDMDKVDKETEKQLSEHLTSDQMATWEKLEKERQERMRDQMRNRN